MLPYDFPIEEGLPPIHPYVYTAEPGEYEVSLDFGADCQGAGACHYGSLTGKKVDSNEPVGTRNFIFDAERAQKVTLTNGIEGYFIESVCGASCVVGASTLPSQPAFPGIEYSSFNSLTEYEQDLVALGFPDLLPYVVAGDFAGLYQQCQAFDQCLQQFLTEHSIALNAFVTLDELQQYLDVR